MNLFLCAYFLFSHQPSQSPHKPQLATESSKLALISKLLNQIKLV